MTMMDNHLANFSIVNKGLYYFIFLCFFEGIAGQGQSQREIFYGLVQLPNEYTFQGWTRMKAGTRSFIQISQMCNRSQNTEVTFHCYLRNISGELN